MARPPRITSTRRQPTTPRHVQQPTTTGGRWFRPGFRGINTGPRAPVTPAAPAAPTSAIGPAQYSLSNLPPDATYDQAVALLARQRDENQAAIVGERARTLGDYGFNEGPGGTLAFDPNNPFSKAALLKKSYDTNRRSTAQSMGAGGQLYSGAYQNAQDLVNRNELQSQDAMQKALIGFLARNTAQTKEAGTGFETAAGQAYGDRVGRFQTNPNYDPATLQAQQEAAAAKAAAAAAGKAPVRTASVAEQNRRFQAARRRNPRGVWGR